MSGKKNKNITLEQTKAITELFGRGMDINQIVKVTKISRPSVTRVVDEIMLPKDPIKIEIAKKRLTRLTKNAGKTIIKKVIEGGAEVIKQKVIDKAFMSKFNDLQSKTETLLQEASNNHETALKIAAKLLSDLHIIVNNPDGKLSINEIERAMKVLESSATTMSILFENIGIDLRSELTNNRLTAQNKNISGPPMFSFINSEGKVVDVMLKDKNNGNNTAN